jgi:hypothetical protein
MKLGFETMDAIEGIGGDFDCRALFGDELLV